MSTSDANVTTVVTGDELDNVYRQNGQLRNALSVNQLELRAYQTTVSELMTINKCLRKYGKGYRKEIISLKRIQKVREKHFGETMTLLQTKLEKSERELRNVKKQNDGLKMEIKMLKIETEQLQQHLTSVFSDCDIDVVAEQSESHGHLGVEMSVSGSDSNPSPTPVSTPSKNSNDMGRTLNVEETPPPSKRVRSDRSTTTKSKSNTTIKPKPRGRKSRSKK